MIKEPIIEDIPIKMENFFGCSGKMLKPSKDIVKTILKSVKKGNIITLEQLRELLANDFNVQTACPFSTTKAILQLAEEKEPACYWRVVKKNGELNSKLPNGVEGHASLLKKEGLKIDFSKKIPVVSDYETKLIFKLDIKKA